MRIIHDVNCTWCKHRKELRDKKGKLVSETCGLTGINCPDPMIGPTPRYCERFQQKGCPCEKCNS